MVSISMIVNDKFQSPKITLMMLLSLRPVVTVNNIDTMTSRLSQSRQRINQIVFAGFISIIPYAFKRQTRKGIHSFS